MEEGGARDAHRAAEACPRVRSRSPGAPPVSVLGQSGERDRDDLDAVADALCADDRTPDVIERDEVATDVRDVFTTFERLDGRRVADRTIIHHWNDDASTSDDRSAFVPSRDRNLNRTATVVDDEICHDTGCGGDGGFHVMAAIVCDDVDVDIDETTTPRDVTGADRGRAAEYLRNDGFGINVDEGGYTNGDGGQCIPVGPSHRVRTPRDPNV